MRRLILLRHAKAVRPGPDTDDFERGLEPRGRAEAARAAKLLADLALFPDVVLVSPAARTRDTWSIVADTLKAPKPRFEGGIYDASVKDLLDIAAPYSEAGTVLMVGHNPGFKDLARALMGEGPHDTNAAAALSRGLPTSCAPVLALDGTLEPGTARLIALIAPERDDDDAS
jgi:phosphohistidine phosphatase